MIQIFISYRRTDVPLAAALLYDQLRQRLDADRVFMDKSSLIPGQPFPAAVNRALNECSMLVAVLGPKWRGPRKGSSDRLYDPSDFVRREIRTALSRDIAALPLIVAPSKTQNRFQDLPSDITALADQQALEVRLDDSLRDMAFAAEAIAARLNGAIESPTEQSDGIKRVPLQNQTTVIKGGVKGARDITIGIDNSYHAD